MKPLEFHPYVQRDLSEALKYYSHISLRLEDRFWNTFETSIAKIQLQPSTFHFDRFTGYRRLNMETFPYNILFIEYPEIIRVQVLRHNKRRENYGSYREKR